MNFYHIECVICHTKTTEQETTSVCHSCGGPLEVFYDYDYIRNHINVYLLQTGPIKAIKYLDFYPLGKRDDLKSLGEGGTTLHHAINLGAVMGLTHLYMKNEGLNPTGAFKDRGSFVELNKAKELGFKTVCVASTGNMAASVAAYSAQVGLDCYVFVPENTPKGKLAQAISYGAHVIQVRGTYNDAYTLTMEVAAEFGYYLAGDYVFRGEGQKSLSYEVCEQLQFGRIDWVVVPVGMGTNIAYIFKGFEEYYRLGLIKKIPKIVAVQAEGAAPIVAAWKNYFIARSETTKQSHAGSPRSFVARDDMKMVPIEKPQSVCSAIAIGNPIDAPKVFRALKISGGTAVSVTDDEALSYQQQLAKCEAMYVEPSSSTPLAAIDHLKRKGLIKKDDVVIAVATGAGLKDPATTLKILAEPPTIEPVLSEVKRVIKSGLLSLRAGAVGEKEKIIFSTVPSEKDLRSVISTEFGFDLDGGLVSIVQRVLRKFIDIKGKSIAKADLQSIIETVIQDQRRVKVLEIVDYHVETFKRKKPVAEVTVMLHEKTLQAVSQGVGPVDAAIHAITEAIKKTDRKGFKLTDYNVEIPTTGSDATVEVTMTLSDEDGTLAVEKGTSPDIIVASIEAYEKGYNELVYQREKKERKSI